MSYASLLLNIPANTNYLAGQNINIGSLIPFNSYNLSNISEGVTTEINLNNSTTINCIYYVTIQTPGYYNILYMAQPQNVNNVAFIPVYSTSNVPYIPMNFPAFSAYVYNNEYTPRTNGQVVGNTIFYLDSGYNVGLNLLIPEASNASYEVEISNSTHVDSIVSFLSLYLIENDPYSCFNLVSLTSTNSSYNLPGEGVTVLENNNVPFSTNVSENKDNDNTYVSITSSITGGDDFSLNNNSVNVNCNGNFFIIYYLNVYGTNNNLDDQIITNKYDNTAFIANYYSIKLTGMNEQYTGGICNYNLVPKDDNLIDEPSSDQNFQILGTNLLTLSSGSTIGINVTNYNGSSTDLILQNQVYNSYDELYYGQCACLICLPITNNYIYLQNVVPVDVCTYLSENQILPFTQSFSGGNIFYLNNNQIQVSENCNVFIYFTCTVFISKYLLYTSDNITQYYNPIISLVGGTTTQNFSSGYYPYDCHLNIVGSSIITVVANDLIYLQNLTPVDTLTLDYNCVNVSLFIMVI